MHSAWWASHPALFTPGGRAPRCPSWGGPNAGLDNVEKRKSLAPTGSRTSWLFSVPIAVPGAIEMCVCFCAACRTGSESLSLGPVHLVHYHIRKSWSIILATVVLVPECLFLGVGGITKRERFFIEDFAVCFAIYLSWLGKVIWPCES